MNRYPRLTLLTCVATWLGCDAQQDAPPSIAPTELSSFNLEATLQTDAPTGVTLIPTIAWLQAGTYSLTELAFEGELPGSVTIDLDTFPPTIASQRVALAGEPVAAVGLLAAISSEREQELADRPVLGVGSGSCAHLEDGSTDCSLTAEWCVHETTCYIEHFDCTAEAWDAMGTENSTASDASRFSRALYNTQPELIVVDGCTFTHAEGDASLREPLESYMALAENYWLLHLMTPAPAGSITGYLMGQRDAIGAGYSLIEITRFEETAAQTEDRERCEQAARAQAQAEVEAARHVTLAEEDFVIETCTQNVSICEEAANLTLREKAQHNCPFPGYTVRRLLEPDLTTLDMTFGNDPVYPW